MPDTQLIFPATIDSSFFKKAMDIGKRVDQLVFIINEDLLL